VLGPNPSLFVYPYGEYSLKLERIVGDLALVGVGQQSGAIGPQSNFLALPRFPMGGVYSSMDQFPTKVNSLPFPVIAVEPADPVLHQGETRPVLRVTLAPGQFQMESLACYLRGKRIPITWVDRSRRIFETRAERPLPEGRSKYNCTAHHQNEDRYFWFSHLWINNVYHKEDD
jgi:biofilm PGA synthesis lipoprotein PgaB